VLARFIIRPLPVNTYCKINSKYAKEIKGPTITRNAIPHSFDWNIPNALANHIKFKGISKLVIVSPNKFLKKPPENS